MRSRFAILLVIFAISASQAQTTHDFKQGLAVAQCHHYGREAIVTDQLVYQLSSGTLQKPTANARLFTDASGNDVLWTSLQTDSTGKFRGQAIRNGYIYLTYQAARAQSALLNVTGNVMCFVNGEPRGGDIYSDGWMHIPVALKKGTNEILIRCGGFSRWQGVKARLLFPEKNIALSTEDPTLPHIVIGKSKENLLGGIVIFNGSEKNLKGLTLTASLNGKSTDTAVPEIGAGTMHKTAFYFSPAGVSEKGDHTCEVTLKQNGKMLDKKSLTISAVDPASHRSYTFISDIDGSVQYFSVAPNTGEDENAALFLSVHGAGVEAIGQARAYKPKDWGVLVAPTNRRPRGFNWEDWGRIDALEVLELAKKEFNPDPEKIYLTGHSMGGHGTWYLGATYPDKWAAIAPCAGYPTLTGYGSADGRVPDSARSAMEQVLLRASNASNVFALANNYKHHGVYVFHGDADRTVPVTFARQMRDVLGAFHPDFSYYEYPGGSHWFGNESVDWPPLFDYFRWHTLKADSSVDNLHFVTANPGISSSFRWAAIYQQGEPLQFSEINLVRDKKARSITGTTKNVTTLMLDLGLFKRGDDISVTLDSATMKVTAGGEVFFRRTSSGWEPGAMPQAAEKNPLRSGTFKEAFNHRMVFVYGTGGNASENNWAYTKARYDAEVWYYRGNGSVDMVADDAFDPRKYQDRGVILYGNASTNSAWSKLLSTCPINVTRDRITVGAKIFEGGDLAAYFTWPRADSQIASVGVISGTGLAGMKAAEANQYFAAASGFPDYMIFSAEMLRSGAEGIKATGFFDNAWRLNDPAEAAE